MRDEDVGVVMRTLRAAWRCDLANWPPIQDCTLHDSMGWQPHTSGRDPSIAVLTSTSFHRTRHKPKTAQVARPQPSRPERRLCVSSI
ncbi:hypothetical protein N658DRAFT_295107 [Parathielavia hyrcaniae]|uniref:Uncharacterized protein n=1 Tax=Parathielavia hyrcaniae TaxID=113614 RepID=A0AAN6SY94_9PEZI|nr:hypothetical protein N658DRAFT_295107 [Parathielavia hyrcaniae]